MIAENQTTFAHLWTATTDNLENQKQLTSGNINRDGASGLTWTPDGNLVYSSRLTGESDLWSLRLADNFAQQLTKNAGQNNANPIVSADGKFIYFESNRTNSRHIWRIDADGKNPTQITFSDKESEFYPTISNDGKWLYYLKKSPQGNVILRQNLDDKRLENITQQGSHSPNTFIVPSPDGKMLAFNNIRETKGEELGSKTFEIGIVYLEEQNKVKIFSLARVGGIFRLHSARLHTMSRRLETVSPICPAKKLPTPQTQRNDAPTKPSCLSVKPRSDLSTGNIENTACRSQ